MWHMPSAFHYDQKILLEQLRNKVDFAEVLEKGIGQILTWKQPSDKADVKPYLPCSYCFGKMTCGDISPHAKPTNHV